jgi:hypothetical protein
LQTLADEDHQQRRKNTFPGSPQEKGSAAWFGGQYRLSRHPQVRSFAARNTVQKRSFLPNVRDEPEIEQF